MFFRNSVKFFYNNGYDVKQKRFRGKNSLIGGKVLNALLNFVPLSEIVLVINSYFFDTVKVLLLECPKEFRLILIKLH